MYLKEIVDSIGDAIDDGTLKSTGTNGSRTKAWVNEFLFNDFLPRFNWLFSRKSGTVNTVASTATYSLPRWVNHPSKVAQIKNVDTLTKLVKMSEEEAESQYGLIENTDEPGAYVVNGRTRTTYSTGTISATSGTKVITGSGTSFITAGLEQYDVIEVGSYAYTVNTVVATSLTVFEVIISTIAPSTAYIALMDRWTIELFPTPDDAYELSVKANSIVPKLVNDYDVPMLPDDWHHVLVKGGIIKALKHNHEDVTVQVMELEAVIKRLISQEVSESNRVETFKL